MKDKIPGWLGRMQDISCRVILAQDRATSRPCVFINTAQSSMQCLSVYIDLEGLVTACADAQWSHVCSGWLQTRVALVPWIDCISASQNSGGFQKEMAIFAGGGVVTIVALYSLTEFNGAYSLFKHEKHVLSVKEVHRQHDAVRRIGLPQVLHGSFRKPHPAFL